VTKLNSKKDSLLSKKIHRYYVTKITSQFFLQFEPSQSKFLAMPVRRV